MIAQAKEREGAEPGRIVPVPVIAWEKRALEAIEETLINRLGEDIREYEVSGRKVLKHDLQELLSIRDQLDQRLERRAWLTWLFSLLRLPLLSRHATAVWRPRRRRRARVSVWHRLRNITPWRARP